MEQNKQEAQVTDAPAQATPTGLQGGFDLGAIASVRAREDEGNEIHLRGPTGELLYFSIDGGPEKPVLVWVAGSYSVRYQEAKAEQLSQSVQKAAIGDVVEQREVELAASCILRWQGMIRAGKLVELTRKAASELAAAPWALPQLQQGIHNHQGFTSGNSAG